jgi:hypothetical protein
MCTGLHSIAGEDIEKLGEYGQGRGGVGLKYSLKEKEQLILVFESVIFI